MGSVIGMANASGASTASIKYDSFGNVTSATGAGAAINSTLGSEPRYHGMLLDQATGLYHVRARTYDARTGRFTSRDPLYGEAKRPETMNPYPLAFGSTHLFRDPDGRFSLMETGAAVMVMSTLASTASPSFIAFLSRVGTRPTLGSDNITGTSGREYEVQKDVFGRYILTDDILLDQAQQAYDRYLKTEDRHLMNFDEIQRIMGNLDTDLFYQISQLDRDLRPTQQATFVMQGMFGGILEYSAEQVNYIGVGLGFSHFFLLGGWGGSQIAVEWWNQSRYGHAGTFGEHVWMDEGFRLYDRLEH